MFYTSVMGFWENVKAEIVSQNTTQEWVANAIGMDKGAFRSALSKKQEPGVFRALKIAKALNISIDRLVDGADSPESLDLTRARRYRLFLEYLETIDPADRENVLEIARLYADKAKAARERQSEIAADEVAAYGLPGDRPGPGERGHVRYKKRDDDPNFQKPGDVRYKRREVKEDENPDDANSVI